MDKVSGLYIVSPLVVENCGINTELDDDGIPETKSGVCQLKALHDLGYDCQVRRGECNIIALKQGACNAEVVGW